MRVLGPCFVVLVLGVAACAPSARPHTPVPAPLPVAVSPAKPAVHRNAPAHRAAALRPPARVLRVDSMALEFAVTARDAHRPLARALVKRTRNPVVAERAAWAVTREAGRLR